MQCWRLCRQIDTRRLPGRCTSTIPHGFVTLSIWESYMESRPPSASHRPNLFGGGDGVTAAASDTAIFSDETSIWPVAFDLADGQRPGLQNQRFGSRQGLS